MLLNGAQQRQFNRGAERWRSTVLWRSWFGPRLLPTRPVFWPAPMVRQRDQPEFVSPDIVDDTVWEPTQRHAASLSPLRTKLRMTCEKSESSFELCDEGEAKLGATFSGIEERSVG